MSEQTAEATNPAATTENAEATEQQAETVTLPDDHPLVKTLAEQKKAIRDLKARAAKLDEIEEAQKSEAEKAADRLAKAEQRAAEAEAKALRREIALEHSLSKDDADLLDSLTDEAAMRRLAERLAAANADKRKNGNHVPSEGGKGGEPPALNSNSLENALKSKLGIA
jgi:hypothetical protein